jgi:hypothetical protein
MVKYLLAWFPMVLIAIANGVLREKWYGRGLGELQAHQLSTMLCVLFFAVYIWGVVRIWQPRSARQALVIGLMWLGLTIAFEFLFGHYVAGLPWSRLLHDYDLLAGRVWVIALVWVWIAPLVFYRLYK